MTISDVIKRVEKLRPGYSVSSDEYIHRLDILEQDIYNNIISSHCDGGEFIHRTTEEDLLFVPDMYSDLYSFYLLAQIDLANAEISGYTNNMILYNNLMSEFSRYYTRSHMPKQKGRVRWR
ncbi:MAG: hypothetical protein IJA55_03765 [Clostridia bacterium]|nr:hypothetical protein [Clostridia bacterium]